MFTRRRQGRLTSPRAPRTREEAGVLHPSAPRSIPGAGARAGGWTCTQMQAPHTSPRHLNTISQDVETISILKGERSGWPDRLLSVDWSFAELQEWPLWRVSCWESLARDGDDHCHVSLPSMDTSHPLISTLGVELEEELLPFFPLHLCSLFLTKSCPQAQIRVTTSHRKPSVNQLGPKASILYYFAFSPVWPASTAHLCHLAPPEHTEAGLFHQIVL
jgi:hypothetical protein